MTDGGAPDPLAGVQTRLRIGNDGLPIDPLALAALPIADRARVYSELDLHPIEREAAEAAVRMVLAGEDGKAGR